MVQTYERRVAQGLEETVEWRARVEGPSVRYQGLAVPMASPWPQGDWRLGHAWRRGKAQGRLWSRRG
jgi:hypothetical protein